MTSRAFWRQLNRPVFASAVTAMAAIVMSAGCGDGSGMVLSQQRQARTLAADLRAQFVKASDATNQSVMADTDDVSASAAKEARTSREAVEHTVSQLDPILRRLGYADELRLFDEFTKRFAEYRTLDDTILQLAVENTNIKAQRLLFGPAREASDSLAKSLDAIVRSADPGSAPRAELLAARMKAAILEIQVLEGRHIAEADEAAMSGMEARMSALESEASADALALKKLVTRAPASLHGDVNSTLERFKAAQVEIVELSRKNTNVRSLSLALGRKRVLAAGCEDVLSQLSDALAKHEVAATR